VRKYILIIGALLIGSLTFAPTPTHADFCSGATVGSTYKKAYCQMKLSGNKNLNTEIVKTVATQYGIEEALIGFVLEGDVCQKISQVKNDETLNEAAQLKEMGKFPPPFITACLPEKVSIDEQLFAQNLFSDIRNSYEKEKAMYFSKMKLKSKFEFSEMFWDGKINLTLNDQFDLMTDLNLIEKVLFGSQAEWLNDVYEFPENMVEKEDPVTLEELLENKEEKEEENNNENQQEEQDNEAEKIQCVPLNDPDSNPNLIVQNPFCGNGSVDVFLGEMCDDGNKISGDGCNQLCQMELGGSNLSCQDPEAVTFKEPEVVQKQLAACPPGSVPKKIDASLKEEAPQAEQFSSYPGPSIGGTLKQFPNSERPICGPGESPVEIKVGGETKVATDGNGDPRCIPTNVCSDPDKARSIFAATAFPFPIGAITAAEWKDLPEDHPVRESLESIEALYCVNVSKVNRPLTPYAMNEGCIDCHITAIVDSLEEALTTNVTPLENTTSAFGLSSRFGPTFSFNLITTLKPKLKLTSPEKAVNAIDDANEKIKNLEGEAPEADEDQKIGESNQERLDRIQSQNEAAEAYLEAAIGNYFLTTNTISDSEFSGRVSQLITQMRESFQSIQSKFQEMVDSTYLDETPICRI